MKNISLIFKSFIFSVVTTALILVMNVLYLFRPDATEETASFTTYFGAINVDVMTDNPEFGFQMSFGLSDYLAPIWLTIVFFFIFYYVYYIGRSFFRKRKANKELV